ncbi:SAV_915 family protein [Actinopolyspora mortivallis]|uniref:SAV_915 family protein n=1 Tax=Actinopolyspora mortivallis TaxID=33906 RepID=UPI0011B21B17|nr:SAV_915 family protein [Actinopolyspora mortivallis]
MVELVEKPQVYDPDETDLLPTQLYLACRPDEANSGLMLETREFSGQLVVLGYSTLDTFLAGCGADQPWILLPIDKVREIACVQSGTAMVPPTFRFSVAVDAPVPPELCGTAGDWAEDEADWNDPESPDWTTVYLASRPFNGRPENVELELQPMPGGLLAIMAYTSEMALRQGCGPYQTAAPVPAGLLGDVRRQCGAHTICLDTPLPERLRHGGEE